MATPRPKSPKPPGLAKKDDKEESFWEKIGTLGRKKRIKEGMFTHGTISMNEVHGHAHVRGAEVDIRVGGTCILNICRSVSSAFSLNRIKTI